MAAIVLARLADIDEGELGCPLIVAEAFQELLDRS
jgi:hypothetical protein